MIVIGGVTITLMFGGGWIQSGQKPALIAAIMALILTIVAIAIERYVVTDSEQIKATLRQVAADVESNDIDRVIQHIHPYEEGVKALVRVTLPTVTFDEVRITKIHNVTVNAGFEPKQAIAEFNVVVIGSRGRFPDKQRYPRFVTVTFIQHDERWLISHVTHEDAQRGWHGN